jgi:hypothetical protein
MTVTLITSIATLLYMPKHNAELLTLFYDKDHATLLLTELKQVEVYCIYVD